MGGLSVLFIVDYLITSLVFVAAAAAFIKLNRMQSVYQKSLVRKVKKIKEIQNAYKDEIEEDKLSKLERKHAKAIKRLENRIKRVMFFNRNIVVTNNVLLDKTSLSLPNQKEFTFISKLDEMINDFNNKHKRRKSINEPKKNKSKTIPKTENKTETNTLELVETNVIEEGFVGGLPEEEILAESIKPLTTTDSATRSATSMFKTDEKERTL